METKGLKIVFDDTTHTYFASLAQVLGDNLGIRQIFGIKACFIGENICHLCNASTNLIQKFHHESDFIRKTKKSYDNRIKTLNADPNNVKLFGLNTGTILNDLNYFHITSNHMFDLAHDIWEGIGRLEINLLLEQLIKIEKLFSLDLLNDRIHMFNYGQVEKRNKPNSILSEGSSLRVKDKAINTYCLFRFLPCFNWR